MWICNVCHADVEDDSWEQCWQCNSPRSIDEEASKKLRLEREAKRKAFQDCLRCGARMAYAGTRQFHEGAKWGFWLGNLGELFVNREAFVIYACLTCGKVEFFIEGVGDEFRPDSNPSP